MLLQQLQGVAAFFTAIREWLAGVGVNSVEQAKDTGGPDVKAAAGFQLSAAGMRAVSGGLWQECFQQPFDGSADLRNDVASRLRTVECTGIELQVIGAVGIELCQPEVGTSAERVAAAALLQMPMDPCATIRVTHQFAEGVKIGGEFFVCRGEVGSDGGEQSPGRGLSEELTDGPATGCSGVGELLQKDRHEALVRCADNDLVSAKTAVVGGDFPDCLSSLFEGIEGDAAGGAGKIETLLFPVLRPQPTIAIEALSM
jgi:hypothetical protein